MRRWKPKRRSVPTYGTRNLTLRALGYQSYSAYLQSPVWQVIRLAALKLHGQHCWLCSSFFRHMHHLDYSRETLLGRRLDRVVPICEVCHQTVEFKADGTKRTLKQTQDRFRYLERKRYS